MFHRLKSMDKREWRLFKTQFSALAKESAAIGKHGVFVWIREQPQGMDVLIPPNDRRAEIEGMSPGGWVDGPPPPEGWADFRGEDNPA